MRRLHLFVALGVGSLVMAVVGLGAPVSGAVGGPVVSLPTAVVGVVEGNTGSSNVTLAASLSAASTSPVTVHYATTNGTATLLDGDYVAASGDLTFAPGTTTASITVAVNGDTKLEDYQQFAVRLSAPSGATLGNAIEKIEIRNDEKPKLVFASVKVAEGTPAHFLPKLAQRFYLPITVTAQTVDATA